MKINESLKKLEEKGYRVDEDKAIFNLEDGSLEIYICLLYTYPSPRDS